VSGGERLRYSILGPVEVAREGEPLPIPGRRQRRLLAALLLRPNQAVPAEQLAEAVWESEPPTTARTALQVHVSQLRKLLGGESIETRAGGYLLRLEADQLDAARFERELRNARAAAEPGRTAALLRDALALFRGPALGDLAAEPFARAEAMRLDELRIAATEERLAAEIEAEPDAPPIGELEALVSEHPLRERPRALLMLALYRAGRQAEALAAYRDARQMLVDELGIEPGAELRELERAILSQDASLRAAGAGAPPPSLPTPATPLVGRERELGETEALLVEGHARLLTLTGPGGIGKTRLAIELARTLAPAFGGAVVFVSLAAIADPMLVGSAIAQAVGAKLSGGRSTTAALVERLRERATLLVVDNFEQVASARLLIADLLAAVPALTVVVASRAVLHLSGEHEYPVPPLDPDSATQLFVERARAALHGFAPGGEELDAVAAICARLDRLPLAIELAAARTKMLSPAALLSRIGSLDLLRAGARDTPERQQTLRATIDWSHELLTEDEQRLFARLAVFVDGWTLEQAEAVCGTADVLDGLATLVDNSLVKRSGHVEPRFSMLETVRDYALERLDAAADANEVRRRHADVFVELAESFERQYYIPDQQVIYDRLELEHGNVRAALAFLLATDADGALRLAAALRRFWQVHGHLAEGRRLLEAALATEGAEAEARAKAVNGLGIIVAQQGDFDEAARLFAEALELARRLDDAERIATAVSNLGNVRLYQGRLADARAAYVEAREVWGASGDLRGIVTTNQNIANLDLVEGRQDDAFRLFEETAALAREHGDPLLLSALLRDLARGLIEAGRLAEARAALAEAYPVVRELGHLWEVAGALELYAAIAAADRDADRAASLLGAAAGIRDSIGAVHRLEQTDLVEDTFAAVRERLGEQAFAEAYERGQRLPLEQATELPLAPIL